MSVRYRYRYREEGDTRIGFEIGLEYGNKRNEEDREGGGEAKE